MATANDTSKVTVGKPKVGGAIFRAPLGSTLPVDAKAALDNAFLNLGFVSDDGIENDNSVETEDIKAWGGQTVLTPVTEIKDTFKFKLIQFSDAEAKKVYFGENNVTGSLETGMTVKVNGQIQSAACYVIEMLLNGNILHRIVIPNGTVAERSEIVYADGEAVGYEVTITAAPDAQGNTHYEYSKKGE